MSWPTSSTVTAACREGSGFLARFLVSQPASLQGSRLYKEPTAMPELARVQRPHWRHAGRPADDRRRARLDAADARARPHRKGALGQRLRFDRGAAIERRRLRGGPRRCVKGGRQHRPPGCACCTVSSMGRAGRSAYGRCRARPASSCGTSTAPARCWRPSPCHARRRTPPTLDRWLIDRCQMEGRLTASPTRDVLNGGPNGTRKREDFDGRLEVLVRPWSRSRWNRSASRRSVKVNPAADGTARRLRR